VFVLKLQSGQVLVMTPIPKLTTARGTKLEAMASPRLRRKRGATTRQGKMEMGEQTKGEDDRCREAERERERQRERERERQKTLEAMLR
jgi:hypothetical protein